MLSYVRDLLLGISIKFIAYVRDLLERSIKFIALHKSSSDDRINLVQ